jgi:hypothetical protein
MQFRMTIPVLILVCVALSFAGCTGTPVSPVPAPTGSVLPVSTTPAGASLVPVPTDVLPDYHMVTVDVGEKDYLGIIPVTFQGGMGMNSVKKIDVKITRSDGTVQTAVVGTKKGDEVEMQGTRGSGSERGQTDRVEVWVSFNTGQTYKVADVLREYRSRG